MHPHLKNYVYIVILNKMATLNMLDAPGQSISIGASSTTVSIGALGDNTTSGANIVEVIMDLIANQNAANFSASFAIVHPVTLAAINKVLLTNGYYPGAAGISSVANGSLAISGTPVIAASWAVAGNVLIIDADYCESAREE